MAANEGESEPTDGNGATSGGDRRAESGLSQRRKPPAITIDLAASSVRIETPPAAEKMAEDPETAAASPTTAETASAPDAAKAEAMPTSGSGLDDQPAIAPETGGPGHAAQNAAPDAASTSHKPVPTTERLVHRPVWPQLIAASLVGGGIGFIAAYGIAGLGFWPQQGNAALTAQLAALDARLATTEGKVGPSGELSVELQHLKSMPSISGVTVADVEKILDPFTAKTAAAVAHMDEIDRKIAGEQAIVRGEGKALQTAMTGKITELGNTVTSSAAETKQIAARLDTLQQDLTGLDKKSTDQIAAAHNELSSTLQSLAARLNDLDTRTAAELAVIRGTQRAVGDRLTSSEKTTSEAGSDIAAIQKTLAANADAIGKLQAELQPIDDMKKAIDGLGARIGAVDDVKQILAQQNSKLNTADDAKKAADGVAASLWVIDQRMANLQARLTDIDTLKTALAGDTKAIAALDMRVAPVEAKLASLDGYARQGRDARKDAIATVAIANLKSAAETGLPFANELTAAKTVVGTTFDLTSLDAFASKGLTPTATLIDSFDLAAHHISETGTAAGGTDGFLGALLSHAAGTVQVTPATAEAGDTLAARLSRISSKLKSRDLDAALAEWQALPEAARNASAEWGGQLSRHVAGTKAVAALSEQVLAKLTSASE